MPSSKINFTKSFNENSTSENTHNFSTSLEKFTKFTLENLDYIKKINKYDIKEIKDLKKIPKNDKKIFFSSLNKSYLYFNEEKPKLKPRVWSEWWGVNLWVNLTPWETNKLIDVAEFGVGSADIETGFSSIDIFLKFYQ